MSDYQQDCEYALPALLREALGAGCALDIGAECGGFSAACVAAGWPRIEAFEPLPRHAAALRARFAGEPRVRVHQLALSDRSGACDLHIAVDAAGRELDYHHTLAGMADTETVFFTRHEPITALTPAQAAATGLIPLQPDFVKLDTEGHDLAIIRALGPVRPRMLMCEFWRDLPKTSGTCPYSLAELAATCAGLGLPHLVAFRHRDGFAWADRDDTAESPGEWGNALFVSAEAWASGCGEILSGLVARSSRALLARLGDAVGELAAKESVIRGLAAAAQERLELIERLSAASRGGRA